ncbi:MAG: N-acetylglucosamine-6-phosphate deacetylase [Candidatus Aminicenantes bacterium]|nr:N-acetylglucosamine-6-phosphate deacetylase [Candidatus Aminicenantes bacterium]
MMKVRAIRGNLILPDRVIEDGLLVIKDEKIEGVYRPEELPSLDSVEFIDRRNHWISPGLIDVHLHGALGKEVMDGEVESLRQMASHQAACGVTGFFPTTLTSSLEAMTAAIEAVKEAKKENLPSEILGIHLEGPFVSLKRKGAQDPKYIREINEQELERLAESLNGLKTLITIAPEAGRNLDYIKKMTELGWVVSIGHSDATYDEARKAIEAGSNHATHLFNAWREFHHREPGGIGAVLDSDQVFVELIADGIHVHPCFIRLAVFRKGKDRVCLITDSLKETGLPDGTYAWGGLEVVLKGNEIRLKDSGVLAGSVLHLNHGVKNVLNWTGLTVPEVVSMASLTPAKSVGLEAELGSLEKGKLANLAVFDQNFETVETYVRGRRVYPERK